ncbi:sigma 54-interacting transcriptional regulator [Alkalihalobacillus oceani]|uniref:Sigma 54-interacting transcriptional regulator n=1 Tax=Halalkalibacter oceani TaxID=1653776 RepID=A0A9X2IPU6_9BACI|nr:sigma 54-interacting transcriptional regulator [Halalkalibacter oceani]MCM3714787.1 sigma 54-interacting transcriptional regulator [Halalkalibacter oceani]
MEQQLHEFAFRTAEPDSCGYWAEPVTFVVYRQQSVQEWARLIRKAVHPLIVIDEQNEVWGTIEANTMLRLLTEVESLESVLPLEALEEVAFVESSSSIHDIRFNDLPLVLVKHESGLAGAITKERWRQANEHFLRADHQQKAILETILESAYEGVVIVDKQGKIVSMNKAYLSFLGKKTEQEVIGKFVGDVIDNTELHHVVKSGMPQRGKVQIIQGQKMVVHRIPIWQRQDIIGAIGMLIFEGVSELYQILQQAGPAMAEQGKAGEPSTDSFYSFEQMIGKSRALQTCKSFARKAARTKATVLITGESGTGKELFARSIHHLSSQNEGPFVAVNCAAVPESLLEAELFGYEEGAFTGAKRGGASGKFEQASGGTLFLDEVADMSPAMQAKLLRVLETKELTRVGGSGSMRVDVRLIAATNTRLEGLVESGAFRQDLYYRLNVIPLQLPPLRERMEDIPLLLSHYMERCAADNQMKKKQFGEEALRLLLSYDWPGNVRELVNTVDYVMTMTDGAEVGQADLPHIFQNPATPAASLKEAADAGEKHKIREVLLEVGGNKTEAAKRLGIHRATLYRKLKEFQLD